MKNTVICTFASLLLLSGAAAQAEMELIAPDGKRVLLKDDMTWQYVDETKAQDHPARQARLALARLEDKAGSCRVGFRMQNDLSDKIVSLVLRFSAYTEQEIRYETVSKGFQYIKPTRDQYQEILFNGLPCDKLNSIRVHGGDRCNIGELTKHSAKHGECLEKVYVEASDKVSIYKRYSEEGDEAATPSDE